MRVVDGSLNSGSPVESGRTQEAQRVNSGTGRAAAAQSGGGDQVDLSAALGTLARAMSTFDAGRASQVRALAAQYQSGAYRTDSAATSRSMVDAALTAKDD